MCKTGSGAGKRSGYNRTRSVGGATTHCMARMDDQAGKRKRDNTDAVRGWRVHTADNTPSRDAATRSKHCNFMCQGDIRPKAAAESSQNTKKKIKKIGHHARPRRAWATAPLRTGADMCRTGVGAGSSAGADKGPDRRQSNHERTDDQAGRRRPANTDGGSRVHTADDTPSRKSATRAGHCNFMITRQGGRRPSAAAGSRRNWTRQSVAATAGVWAEGNIASNTAVA